jgi:hypothetical protein
MITTWAVFFQAAAEDATLLVPSPVYLLQLMYDEQGGGSSCDVDLCCVLLCYVRVVCTVQQHAHCGSMKVAAAVV